MEPEKMMTPEDEEKFNKYFRRVKVEVRKNVDKKWDAKKYAASASGLLARVGMNQDPEFAEEAATYILAATYQKRGDKQ